MGANRSKSACSDILLRIKIVPAIHLEIAEGNIHDAKMDNALKSVFTNLYGHHWENYISAIKEICPFLVLKTEDFEKFFYPLVISPDSEYRKVRYALKELYLYCYDTIREEEKVKKREEKVREKEMGYNMKMSNNCQTTATMLFFVAIH